MQTRKYHQCTIIENNSNQRARCKDTEPMNLWEKGNTVETVCLLQRK